MTGSIPPGWDVSMPNLMQFSLETNFFTGTIPSELGNIIPLQYFHFFENSFTGSVDRFFCGDHTWISLVGDCSEVDCSCCTDCCYDEEYECYVM